MAGGGELAAVFQARRVSKSKVEEVEASSTSGELAAVFQARKKVNNNHGDDDNAVTPAPRPPAAVVAAPLTPSSVVGLPMSSPNKGKVVGVTNNKYRPTLPLLPSPNTTPDTSASVTRNKALTAKFESRDLEAGIPTSGFLQDARKNLKKPGEKKVVVANNNNPAAAVTGLARASSAEKAKLQTDVQVQEQTAVQVQEQRDEGEGGLASSSSTKTTSSRDQSHQDLMAARRSRMVALRSAKSDNIVGGGSGGGGTSTNNNKTAANNSTSLSINTSTSSVETPTLALNNQKSPPPPATPASARREKLRARVRANSHHHLKPKSSSQSTSQDNLRTDFSDELSAELSAGKIYITSPKQEEFEMSFFEANHRGPIPDFDNNGNDQYQQKQKLLQQTQPHFQLRTDSVESIYKDLHTTSTGSTLKTANNSSQHSGGGVDDIIGFREHNASTPKISGSQHSVYEEEEGVEEKYVMVGGRKIARPVGIHRRESSNGSTDQYNHLTPYALSRSPSQGSQMSAITNPSCFSQENIAFPSLKKYRAHVKPILEVDSFGNSASGSTANKSGNEETIHLREQMKEFKKKLDEKDAIISQLMKRISDLEQGNSFGKLAAGGGYHQQPPPRSSYSTDGNSVSAFSTPNPVILSPKLVSNMGRYSGDRRDPFNNSSSQSVQSLTSTDRKKFVC